MDRRHFLHAAVGTVGASILPSCGAGASAAAPSVIVIGAGIAGLAAASELSQKNHRVTVLEARSDRYGGRLWTDTSLGVALDLGASWIHGIQNNPIKALANTLNASMATTSYNSSMLYGMDGQPTDAKTLGLDTLTSAVKSAVKAGQSASADASLYNTIWKAPRPATNPPTNRLCCASS